MSLTANTNRRGLWTVRVLVAILLLAPGTAFRAASLRYRRRPAGGVLALAGAAR
ncbi:MAG TPA: hypothetical protein VGO85_21515 [Caldimonas sp.]|jgi:hypothetical protein|nr:hypothetical protein [Caldimonas sp.]